MIQTPSLDFANVLSAISAHWEAWEKAGILHRDVSANNIMIDLNTDHGLLLDWDLSKPRDQVGLGAAQPDGRTVSKTLRSLFLAPQE